MFISVLLILCFILLNLDFSELFLCFILLNLESNFAALSNR